MKSCITSMAVAAFLAVAASAPAGAATLTFFGSQEPAKKGGTFYYDALDDRAKLICSLACKGLLSSQASGTFQNGTNVPDPSTRAGFSDTAADLFDLASSSDASQLAFINLVADPDLPFGKKTEVGGESVFSFVSSAQFILLQIGKDPNYALIQNLVAKNKFDFTAFEKEGAGLSHYTEFGAVSAIPLPAALPLFLTSLAGLGFLGWRRRRETTA